MSASGREWDALAADWQTQETPAVDITAVRRAAKRRGAWLRIVVASEIVLTLASVLVLGVVAGVDAMAGPPRVLLVALAAVLLVYQAAMLWIRRRQWSEAGLDGDALLALEIRRARTVRTYWRWGLWTCLLIWLGIYAFFLLGLAAGWPLKTISGWVGALGVNVVVIPLMGAYGVWRSRAAAALVTRYQALREQLRGP